MQQLPQHMMSDVTLHFFYEDISDHCSYVHNLRSCKIIGLTAELVYRALHWYCRSWVRILLRPEFFHALISQLLTFCVLLSV